MEARLLATINASNGKLGDLHQDVNDHERQLFHLKSEVTDHNKHLSDLNSILLTQDSLLKGYRTTNDNTAATLCTDVNNTRARIPKLRRKIQDSVASLKAIEALVFCQQEQVNHVGSSTVTIPIWGASVNPPHTPSPNRFNLPENLNPTFRGAASFPSGNRPPGDTDAPPDPGAHQDSTSIGGYPR